MKPHPWRTAALFGFAGVVVGSFLPWARVWVFTATGTDGNGVYTLVLGAAGALLLLTWTSTPGSLLAAGAGLASLAIAVHGLATLDDLSRDINLFGIPLDVEAEAGQGLYLTLGASLLASAACLASVAIPWRGTPPPPS